MKALSSARCVLSAGSALSPGSKNCRVLGGRGIAHCLESDLFVWMHLTWTTNGPWDMPQVKIPGEKTEMQFGGQDMY